MNARTFSNFCIPAFTTLSNARNAAAQSRSSACEHQSSAAESQRASSVAALPAFAPAVAHYVDDNTSAEVACYQPSVALQGLPHITVEADRSLLAREWTAARTGLDVLAEFDAAGRQVISIGETYLECALDCAAPLTPRAWHELGRIAASMQGELLFDIMRGWEMEDGAWLQDSPLILRFELLDIVIEPLVEGRLRIWHGVVDEECDCLLHAEPLPGGEHLTAAARARHARELCRRNACMAQSCWLSYQPLIGMVGAPVNAAKFLDILDCMRPHDGQAQGRAPRAGFRVLKPAC